MRAREPVGVVTRIGHLVGVAGVPRRTPTLRARPVGAGAAFRASASACVSAGAPTLRPFLATTCKT